MFGCFCCKGIDDDDDDDDEDDDDDDNDDDDDDYDYDDDDEGGTELWFVRQQSALPNCGSSLLPGAQAVVPIWFV